VAQDTIQAAPATLQLYKKTPVFSINFTLNFFLPPLNPVLLPVMLSALFLRFPRKVLSAVADNFRIGYFCGGPGLLFTDTVILGLQRLYLCFSLFWRYLPAIL